MRRPYSVDTIDLVYLQSLIGEQEGYSLEFKRELNLGLDQNKVELAADISSLANESGGDVFVGIEEASGVASALVGVDDSALDALDRQIAQSLQSRTDPRVPLTTKAVSLGNGRSVVVIRVPRSVALHAVRINDNLRFLGRSRSGKYILNVDQIRERFLLQGDVAGRIEAIVARRIGHILSSARPVLTKQGPRFVLHVIPIGALLRTSALDVQRAFHSQGDGPFHAIAARSDESRLTVDGVVFGDRASATGYEAYSQAFRDGVLERVDTDIVETVQHQYQPREIVDEPLMLEYATEYLLAALQGLLDYGVEPPYYVAATVLGVEGRYLKTTTNRSFRRSPVQIDRDRLDLPISVVEDLPKSKAEVFEAIRPTVEALFNAGGVPSVHYYTPEGRWRGWS